MAQPQSQQDLLKFQGKRIKDQSESIAEQSKMHLPVYKVKC